MVTAAVATIIIKAKCSCSVIRQRLDFNHNFLQTLLLTSNDVDNSKDDYDSHPYVHSYVGT